MIEDYLDFYGYGYATGVWINGEHWYGDPYRLYSDFTTDRMLISDPLYIYNDGGQGMYVFYNAILADKIQPDPDPDPGPTPVPEPSALFLFIIGLWIIKRFYHIKFT